MKEKDILKKLQNLIQELNCTCFKQVQLKLNLNL